MSIVIVGGNEKMVDRYEDICRNNGYNKAKIFPKNKGQLKKKLGTPDLMVFFTNTVSHKMVNSASATAKKNNIPVIHCHTSSATALDNILSKYNKTGATA